MYISVKSELTGTVYTIMTSREALVEEIKELIFNRSGWPSVQQRLVYKGKQLEDGRTLADYGICDDFSTINLCTRLRGGMFHKTSGRSGGYENLSYSEN